MSRIILRGEFCAMHGTNGSGTLSVAQRIKSGAVHINGPTVSFEGNRPYAGCGGASGYGRFGGRFGIDEYTDKKVITLNEPGGLDETAEEALEHNLKSCKVKAEKLQEIFQKVIRKDDDKWYDRYKKALGTLGKEGKVECLMEGILKDIQVLACERLMGTATEAQVKEIEEATKQMNEMPSSLPDEARGVIQTHHGGGDNIAHLGPGTLKNYKAISMHFGSKLYKQTINMTSCLTDSFPGQIIKASGIFPTSRPSATKGGLLKDSYRWILDNTDFQRWRQDEQSRLLWIKGDPGKGKTMLLCGIIDELTQSTIDAGTA
ncbi:uncharacterized protein PAC_18032 [Phialocephala subalpina]|uniref:NACHT domain-containing protein n=1 Tax=Phialocephala subalpina TaxID=576137 RepID=A0A1L7XSX2_9HELO|nr:uncharacterized protein PAC_18032 [Phialocephala subalpina]